jgi:hypothetical protein
MAMCISLWIPNDIAKCEIKTNQVRIWILSETALWRSDPPPTSNQSINQSHARAHAPTPSLPVVARIDFFHGIPGHPRFRRSRAKLFGRRHGGRNGLTSGHTAARSGPQLVVLLLVRIPVRRWTSHYKSRSGGGDQSNNGEFHGVGCGVAAMIIVWFLLLEWPHRFWLVSSATLQRPKRTACSFILPDLSDRECSSSWRRAGCEPRKIHLSAHSSQFK